MVQNIPLKRSRPDRGGFAASDRADRVRMACHPGLDDNPGSIAILYVGSVGHHTTQQAQLTEITRFIFGRPLSASGLGNFRWSRSLSPPAQSLLQRNILHQPGNSNRGYSTVIYQSGGVFESSSQFIICAASLPFGEIFTNERF